MRKKAIIIYKKHTQNTIYYTVDSDDDQYTDKRVDGGAKKQRERKRDEKACSLYERTMTVAAI